MAGSSSAAGRAEFQPVRRAVILEREARARSATWLSDGQRTEGHESGSDLRPDELFEFGPGPMPYGPSAVVEG